MSDINRSLNKLEEAKSFISDFDRKAELACSDLISATNKFRSVNEVDYIDDVVAAIEDVREVANAAKAPIASLLNDIQQMIDRTIMIQNALK